MISDRKKDHVDLTLHQQVEYVKSAGFERIHFRHNALPELHFKDIDPSSSFLGKSISFPLFISSMTGGYSGAGSLNAKIAEFCEYNQIPFGVGSQRAMLEDPSQTKSFSIARKLAPRSVICSNIGGAQLIEDLDKDALNLLIDSIEADAVIVHLNPLQELIQKEGDRNFSGILRGIERLKKQSPVPILVKETGAGISGETAQTLLNIGVDGIDVAGAGGTSWAKVEDFRNTTHCDADFLMEWGIPTVDCLHEVSKMKSEFSFTLIASGGIRNAEHMLKALCLGADLTAMAAPVLKILSKGGLDVLQNAFDQWKDQFMKGMLLLGASDLSQLGEKKVYLS